MTITYANWLDEEYKKGQPKRKMNEVGTCKGKRWRLNYKLERGSNVEVCYLPSLPLRCTVSWDDWSLFTLQKSWTSSMRVPV